MNLMILDNIGKSYPIFRSEWCRVGRWFGLPFKPQSEHWVLRNLDFSIRQGESIGIVGQNGAGKSTLLKIITGTLIPTEGRIAVNGRISAILELGMGFNPELTGRQNAFHAAGLMGFNQDEIEILIPEIESFAEIGDYFDQPLRTYSSGMQMRVAFGVATAYRPEILIIDEALSVGDAYFQHKSYSRIREFQEQGTTLLIVSHDRSAIQSLCSRAILLQHGGIAKDGRPEEIFDYYNALIAEKENSSMQVKMLGNGKAQTTSGTGQARVQEISLYNSQGKIAECICVGEFVELRIKVRIVGSIDNLVLGYGIKDKLGQVMYGTNTWHTGQVIKNPNLGALVEFRLKFQANLGVGAYSIQTALVDGSTHMSANYEWRDLALMFEVINADKRIFSGNCWLEPNISIEAI